MDTETAEAVDTLRVDHLVEIKRIQELDLIIIPPTHHAKLPTMSVSNQRNHGSPSRLNGSFATRSG